ncbi:MAG: hypothetical protein U0271_47455 [Polyangiaceae bacterium]
MSTRLAFWLLPFGLTTGTLGACSDDSTDPPDTHWAEAFDATETGWLLDVWGPNPTALYAVGGAPGAGVVMHFDGASWTKLELPAGTPLLAWAYGFSESDITFVGDAGTILHYDGQSFSAATSNTTEHLWGVWGAAPDDLYAVGGSGRAEAQPTVLHFDGSNWSVVTLPPLSKANVHGLFKVWGTASDNVYVVGQRGTVLHFDGSSWTELLVGASDDLISIWGVDANHVYAVGGRSNGIIARFDGTEWRTQSLAPLPALNGVFVREPGVVHVVGITGTIASVDGATLEVRTDESWSTALDLHATFASGGELYAVGGSLASTEAPYQGIALERHLLDEE